MDERGQRPRPTPTAAKEQQLTVTECPLCAGATPSVRTGLTVLPLFAGSEAVRPQRGEVTVPGHPAGRGQGEGWGPGPAPCTVAPQHNTQASVTCSTSTSWQAEKG